MPTRSSSSVSPGVAERRRRSDFVGASHHFNIASGVLTYRGSCQIAARMKLVVGTALGQPLHLMRIVVRDVGGSFGLKSSPPREALSRCAPRQTARCFDQWIEDRRENLTTTVPRREVQLDGFKVAVRDDGTILGLRADITLDQGAYPTMPSSFRDHRPHAGDVARPVPHSGVSGDGVGGVHEQGSIRGVAGPVGGRDARARTTARPRRPPARHLAGPGPPPESRATGTNSRTAAPPVTTWST